MAYSRESPYFSGEGAKAIAQEIREIKNPSVYLVITVAPGFEDLASIANFRIGRGAAVSVAYITNGEDIPSDLNGEMFYQLASRRKEEAYNVLSYLGVQSFFLNVPVDEFSAGEGCFHPTSRLDKILNDRLDSVISEVKPDIIVLDHDPLSAGKQSSRCAYFQDLVLRKISAEKEASSWIVPRLFAQTDQRIRTAGIPVEQRDPIWSKSYSEMALEAEKSYESLRYQIRLWDENESHCYVQLYPTAAKSPFPLDNRLPEIGKALRTLIPAVRSVFSIEKVSGRGKQLVMLHGAIARVDNFISPYEHSLGKSDLRVLATWKLGLERLRCDILGASISWYVSDTVVTPVQDFFLRFGKLGGVLFKGKTRVLFPGVIQKQWVVNENPKEYYDWNDTTTFRVLSPRSIALNSAETPEGFEAMQVRTPFVFMVAHQDSNPNYDFMYRQEIPLIIAPLRSVEVLTPQVAVFRDTSICVRFKSNVRDKSGGVFYVSDPIVSSPQKRVELPGKNCAVTDTLPLTWDTLLVAPHEVKIWATHGIPIGNFTAHSLDVKVNIKGNVGLCSVVENSPVQIALRRLGVRAIFFDKTESLDKDLSKYSEIIIDRFSFQKFFELFERHGLIAQWLNKGGRLIVLPQYGLQQPRSFGDDEVKFRYLPAVGCNEKLNICSSDKMFQLPNKINKRSFGDGHFVESYGEVAGKAAGSRVLISLGKRVLLLEKKIGNGEIFYCTLNLYPRLLEINQSSYRLLANLLSN
ncbi:MAG TPA: PIG-L family deacetylase [Candidatus Acidoferrales bacterium]|nr:PIG-L family deacetylase [Candidatus Acidoferrales bacterium]